MFERHKLRLHLLGQREAGVSALTIVDRTATDTCLYPRMHVRTRTVARRIGSDRIKPPPTRKRAVWIDQFTRCMPYRRILLLSENLLRTLTERGTGPGVWSSSLTSARV